MPTYDYRCQKCDHEFEVMQRITESPLRTCPKCKGKVKRLIGGGAGVIFKGSGFYVTDSRSSSSARPGGNGSSKDESSSSEKSSDSGAEKKDTSSSSKDSSKSSDS